MVHYTGASVDVAMKRAASGPHGDKDTGHIAADDEIEEAFTPRQATAAQMAKRK